MNDEVIAAPVRIASAEPLTRAEIFARLEGEFGPLGWCHLDTLGNALKAAGLTFKRHRMWLKKKRDKEAFRIKQGTLAKLQQAARETAMRLLFLDEAGFCGSSPVQRSWSPRGLPHAIEPNTHCRRSVLGALDFGSNELIHARHTGTVKGPDVMRFIDSLLAAGDGRPTVIVLDNASIHHGIDEATRERRLIDHKALLFYLPAYSPELNKIGIVWRHLKYRWRRFVTWTKETIDAELANLLGGYGIKYQINFS